MSTDLAKQYQQKTDKQHIPDNPDTYIGSVENVDADMWVFDDETQKIKLKTEILNLFEINFLKLMKLKLLTTDKLLKAAKNKFNLFKIFLFKLDIFSYLNSFKI
jgi:hypothetical protein